MTQTRDVTFECPCTGEPVRWTAAPLFVVQLVVAGEFPLAFEMMRRAWDFGTYLRAQVEHEEKRIAC